MSGNFNPIPLKKLLQIILNELHTSGSVFGIPSELFFIPDSTNTYKTTQFNTLIDTPVGVAAGPHSQMAQNIIAAWLMGARYIELKTIQTLDELEVPKPCIDMQDEGYNCEWSQELRINQSFNEYLNAWIIIHILHQELGFSNNVNTVFNMSVGYNLEGIMQANVQWFFEKMNDCTVELTEKLESIKDYYPEITALNIPSKISDNITLSTMHGCPANEIESIAFYLLTEKKLHTYIKLNPTLLGPDQLRQILNHTSKFKTQVPDIAFEHDLKYPDALKIIRSLQKTATDHRLCFGVKLTNTLESVNNKNIFSDNVEMMYMSGRALHPVSIALAKKLNDDLQGEIPFSFSAGVDAFNISDLISCGFQTITVCSDLLKPGGYMRLNQYFEELSKNFSDKGVSNIKDFILATAGVDDITQAKSINLSTYFNETIQSSRYRREYITTPSIKTQRQLGKFDCISAPCKDSCATNQDIPNYMYHTSQSDFKSAYRVILQTNPFPAITGMICDHLCQNKCTRINYDSALHIREVKRFISEQNEVQRDVYGAKNDVKVAVVGAGPSGLSCAYYLALAGFQVDVFEEKSQAGGMVQFAVPGFRLSDEAIRSDFKRVADLGVNIHYNSRIDTEKFELLRKSYTYIYLAPGAQLSANFTIEGYNSRGVIDSLGFLFKARKREDTGIGKNIVIVGGGNTAMDAARTAWRLVGKDGKVTIVYRRTINEMPADQGEIKAVIEEGIEIIELVAPEKVISYNGRVSALLCSRMELSGKDASGRPKPVKIPNSEFEISCDTIIPALGQMTNIDFVQNDMLAPEASGYMTKLENIFIGGDAKRNAATAIIAISDGRRTAEEIIHKAAPWLEIPHLHNIKNLTKKDLMLKRARRISAIKLWEAPPETRQSFAPVSRTPDKQSIVTESGRCLYCDEICNICTTVCPNFANRCYEIAPMEFMLKKAQISENGKIELIDDVLFSIQQKYQIINIANFCNECGNCNTFCPTSSAPYIEKPKIWLTAESFASATKGYYFDSQTNALLFKRDEQLSTLTLKNGVYIFETDICIAHFNATNFSLEEIALKIPSQEALHFYDAAIMMILYNVVKNL
ncbi:MAG: putative selenate reductase subunit YgfK [Bacteroidales bacterium]|nr:putative selenate reductase subunit YgfK [Bacteroidales bacterium]HOY38784.1 putative selenate reductase subunit YgfK [Bacteroidales bacterium]